jgi:hypothetical protein
MEGNNTVPFWKHFFPDNPASEKTSVTEEKHSRAILVRPASGLAVLGNNSFYNNEL